jgi:hypothetical protein
MRIFGLLSDQRFMVSLSIVSMHTTGTTRRIENWETLTEREKQVSWRRIAKRNEERRKVLLQQQEELVKQQEQQREEKAEEL